MNKNANLDEEIISIESRLANYSNSLELPDLYDNVMRYVDDVPRYVLVELLKLMGKPKLRKGEIEKRDFLRSIYVGDIFRDDEHKRHSYINSRVKQLEKKDKKELNSYEKELIEHLKITKDGGNPENAYKRVLRDLKKYKYIEK